MPIIGPQTVYLFDLDNTLYPPEKNLFAHVDMRMTAFIEKKLGLTHDEAFFIQKKYWKRQNHHCNKRYNADRHYQPFG